MDLTLLPLMDDQKCYDAVRRLRWPGGVACPQCESAQVTKRGMDETQTCRQRYHCGGGGCDFHDLTGTVIAGPHQLVREQIDMVHAVVYTHAHADHILGLDDLRIFGYKLKRPIPLYCEPVVEEHLRRTFSYAFVPVEERNHQHSTPDLVFRTIGIDPFDVLGLHFIPLRLIHGELPVLGYRINDVAFCTDVSCIPEETWPKLEGLKVLILDALWDDPHPTHFSVSQALEVIARLKPERAYLTHCSHRLDYEKTNARLPAGVELAYDGLQIPL